MARDFQKESRQERVADDARKAWVRQRIDAIHGTVSAFDVLRQNGIEIQQAGDHSPEQISCPFHGLDRKPSARIFPSEPDSPSHVWCYVCQKNWDVIGLWREFNGGESKGFTQVLSEIERAYGIRTPEVSRDAFYNVPVVDEDMESFKVLHDACEGRLTLSKPDYRRHDDLMGYLTAGSILDRVRHRVARKKLSPTKALVILNQLREKIGEKVRT